ncbi:hypothetical protein BDL97_10G010400 [Sphagnum fallax]|nr:hypothetical protein BDL97_10G010400 [Sphagnum fallax]
MGNLDGLKGKGVDLSQGPPKRKRDVVRIPAGIETPLVPPENAPSSSGWHSNVEYLVHDLNPTCNSNNPNLTIVFFHGIAFGTNDEWKETWTTCMTNNIEECICWPEKWLPEDLNNNVRILSLSYDSNILASVHNDVIEIGKNLIQSLVTNSSYQSLWDGPVALIAYSFGVDFKNAIRENLNIYAFGEGLPLDKNWGILVPYASAIQLSINNHYKIEDANHLTICKPPNKDHPSYYLLLKCLRTCMEVKTSNLNLLTSYMFM